MIYFEAEILKDASGLDLTDTAGEALLCKSDDHYVREVFGITSFVLSPAVASINNKIEAAVKVEEGLIEMQLPVWYSGDLYAGEI